MRGEPFVVPDLDLSGSVGIDGCKVVQAPEQSAIDRIAAHKWFNIAAMLGNQDAIRLRREVAAEMSKAEITTAQRAARHWITTH